MKRILLILTLVFVFVLLGSANTVSASTFSFLDVAKYGDEFVDATQGAVRGTKTTVSLATRFAHLVKPWFPESSLKHIFEGVVDSNGYASGFHHLPSANGAKILRIDSPPNKFGVYSAKVEINGIEKGPISTFFPDHWSREKVAEAIEYVRRNGIFKRSN